MSYLTDIGLPAALAIIGVYMAYLGVDVTIHPPMDDKAKRSLKLKFIVCGAIISLLTVTQGLLSSSNQHALEVAMKDFKEKPMKLEIPGFLTGGLDQLEKDDGLPVFRVGVPIRINTHWTNDGGTPISGVKAASRIWTIRTNSQTDAETHSHFRKAIENEISKKYPGPIINPGGGIYHTDQTEHPMSAPDIADITAGRIRVYVLSHAQWDSKPEGVDFCLFATGPETAKATVDKIPWGGCEY